jgi:trk system potassium uptake protein
MRLSDLADFFIALFGHKRQQPRTKALPTGRQEFAVIGLGRFGSSLARTLVENGHTVLGVDRDPALVQHLADEITQTVALDTTDEDALLEVDIQSYDTVVVAVGSNFESNLLTTVALKAIGVRNVICKAATQRHHDILLKVGADRVVLPEHESGARMAQELSMPGILDQIRLSHSKRVSEVRAPLRLVGKTLAEADLERSHAVFVAAVVSPEDVKVCPDMDHVIQMDDLLVVIGDEVEIARLLAP